MTQDEAFKKLSLSLFNLQERKGKLTVDQVEAEVINQACLDILQNKHFNVIVITEMFTNSAKILYPGYGDKQAMNALIGVPMNVEWEGMWEYLKNYFLANHGINIDGDEDSESKIFYSTRHDRYEMGVKVNDAVADRTIDLFFTENRNVVLVNVQPTLSAKKGYLIENSKGKLIYKGVDPDYKFIIEFDEIDEVSKFILERIDKNGRIEYFE